MIRSLSCSGGDRKIKSIQNNISLNTYDEKLKVTKVIEVQFTVSKPAGEGKREY